MIRPTFPQLTFIALSNCHANTQATLEDALPNLIHLLGDLHQPLHLADHLQGGNEAPAFFTPFNRISPVSTTLHLIYDFWIPNQLIQSYRGVTNFVQHMAQLLRGKYGEFGEEVRRSWVKCVFAEQETSTVRAFMPLGITTSPLRMARRCVGEWAVESMDMSCKYQLWKGWADHQDLSKGAYNERAKQVVYMLIAKTAWRIAVVLEILFKTCPIGMVNGVLYANPGDYPPPPPTSHAESVLSAAQVFSTSPQKQVVVF